MASIPLVDLRQLDVTGNRQELVSISELIQKLGFLILKSPSTPSTEQIASIFHISKRFFEEETSENKEAVSVTVENKGWVKRGQEALDKDRYPQGDLKEAFNITHFVDGNPTQPLPPLLDQHKEELDAFMKSCHTLCMQLLQAFAIDMGLDEDYFTSKHAFDRGQLSTLRLLYYPATTISITTENNSSDVAVPDDIRAGAHSDYGTCTLLFQKDIGGLQILAPDAQSSSDGGEEKWIDAPVIEDTVLVNIGDAFDFWTDGKFKSTLHRVVIIPPGTTERTGYCPSRLSIAYFLHPDDSVLLQPISSYVNGPHGNTNNGMNVRTRFGVPTDTTLTSKEWLLQRLNSTYSGRKPV